jgi:drug/metabolite transporter (DMT)-like permease
MDTNRLTSTESDVGTLIKGAFQDLEKLATQHIKLFKKEINEDVTKAGEGFAALIIGLNIFFIGGVLLCFALAHGLMHAGLPDWAAYLIVGVLVCIGGGVALFLAQNRLKAAANVAPKSLEEIEEDAKWLKNPK